MESGDSFLVVIVDVNSGSWDDPAEGCGAFSDALQSLYLFCNSHKMLGRNNNSCMIAMGERSSAHVSSSGGSAIDAVLAEYGDSSRPAASGHCALGRCLSQAMCVINRHLLVRSGTQCRILVVQASADLPESYNAVMNAIFSAQKSSVVLDALVLGKHDSAFLQQGSYITDGMYMKPERWNRAQLSSLLLSYYVVEPAVRRLIKTPPLKILDFRAACSCHGRQVEYALMCSVCLALQCEATDSCGTCGTCIDQNQ